MDIPTLWVFAGYIVGTLTGWYITRLSINSVFEAGVAATIDELVENGYIKTEKMPDGQVNLVKFDKGD